MYEIFEYYAASESGNIYRRKTGRQLKCETRCHGFKKFNAYISEKKIKHVKVHHFVWCYFNGAIPIGFIVVHINGVKDDNRLSNLRIKKISKNKVGVFRF